ncbi:MAG: bifunctional phosphopantothenoylcysteine decarboxylase/phosphopantothenate--cysteine ligase CoaBC [Alphaproteobacteria bacterium]|nr:bifunctional phosphopantothenoylcysteine decarboxylase/phosphopantothenate--cysteine ligase CoaBC [Alphaproteobacteria bacterium]MBT5158746.1 bifunctional phosphopantothenoylcysteine decarboxylase/phosphopantothenate--cysteine ligase CoaBC [Alphaproteobacteria bacterium]MBT5916984.1 bifunctional phosphopantothenoylcysteine decarboxylase/phosphopantothenate--cysteine ligase CoaBC [Alphaproteobacteria bacterium]MBT6386835.1 bifunctional phosphopantothenoylcysteine decarboxylase/phosphopantothen
MLTGKRILLIIAGGIAAYKSLDLIRRLMDQGASVRCILTKAGAEFVTPLSVSALSGEKVFMDLFDLTDESDMGHIRLSREADLVVVAPATADIMAKMAGGHANDLASTALMATDKPVLIAPAMNVEMWNHPATQRNAATLASDGITLVGPAAGDLACGEVGQGRMVEVPDLIAAIQERLARATASLPLAGKRALVTSGPTREAIDPVRYLSNHSSGKQGHAIAAALAAAGAQTTLVSGPTSEPDPAGVTIVKIESARDMLAACEAALPADIAICAAAVADWRIAEEAGSKMKKNGGTPPPMAMVENPDILATLSQATDNRPRLVIGFAAETNDLIDNATKKRARKQCDWIVANDVSTGTGTFGGDENTVHLVTDDGVEDWPRLSKTGVAEQLTSRIASWLADRDT